MKSSGKLKLFDVEKSYPKGAKRSLMRLLAKPVAFLVLILSFVTILLGVIGLVLPVVPGILLISVGLSLMFYAVDRLQP